MEKEKLFKPFLPLDLQFFAEGGEGEGAGKGEGGNPEDKLDDKGQGGSGGEVKKTLEEIIKEHGLESDFEKQLQSVADKRVTEAIKKTTEKLKAEFEEQQRRAKMTEEEKRAEEERIRNEEIQRKLQEATIKELKYNLVDILNEEGMDLGFRDLIDVSPLLAIEDEKERVETLRNQVKSAKKIVKLLVDKEVEAFKQEFLKGKSPEDVGNKGGKNTPPSKYEQAKKNGSVLDMIKAKIEKAN